MNKLLFVAFVVLAALCAFAASEGMMMGGEETLLMQPKIRIARDLQSDTTTTTTENPIITFLKNVIKTPLLYALSVLLNTVIAVQDQIISRIALLITSSMAFVIDTLQNLILAITSY